MTRHYWPQLVKLAVVLARYYTLHRTSLPSDLPDEAVTALDALVIAADLLILYDKSKAGGAYSEPN